MTEYTIKESAAATAIDTDLIATQAARIMTSHRYRRVVRIGVVGSANPGDFGVDLYYGSTFISRFYNTSGGANLIPLEAKDLKNVGSDLVNEPGEPLRLVIIDAGATNIAVITLDIQEF